MRRIVFLALLAPFALARCDCSSGDGLSTLRPELRATPNPLSFDPAYVGFPATQVLTLENSGEVKLTVQSIRLKEGSSPALSLIDGGQNSFQLAPHQERTVEVRLDAMAEGQAGGAILIASDDPRTPELEVPIVANATRRPGPVLSVDPLRIDFGPSVYGMPKEATITLISAGTADLQILDTRVQPGGHPSISFDPVMIQETLPVNATRVITVRFTPAVPEEVNAVFQIESNDPERSLVPVIVTGSGVAPTLCPSEQLLDFGTVNVGAHADRMLTLENCGNVALELRALEIEADPEFSVEMPPALPQQLDPGATVAVTVRYAPTDGGADNDRLRIRSTLPDGFITLVGRSAACDVIVSPLMLAFGGVGASGSTRAILVQNAGGADCTVMGAQLAAGTSNEFSVSTAGLPATLRSGDAITLDVSYTPANGGSDTGHLLISSSDGVEPSIDVTLTGRRLSPGECALAVQPDPVTFGVVPVGTTQSISVSIQNVGASLCAVSAAALSAGSSRMFQVVPPMFPWLIPASGSETIELLFTPSSATPENAELEIYTGLLLPMPTFIVPISGSGSGALLCARPVPVVFGTHPIGQQTVRQLNLDACGTEAVSITAMSFPAPTSAEFSLPTPPMLPLTIPAGGSVVLDVAHQASNDGRDDGVLRLSSNDMLEPAKDVQLIAHGSNDPCGDLQGRICDLSGSGPSPNTRVYIDTPSGRVETITNQQGDWVLTCLPAGTYTVHAEAGSWTTDFQGTVTNSTVTTIPGMQCLDPGSADVAVIVGVYDQMEEVLGFMGIPYTLYGDFFGPSVSDLLEDSMTLAGYDVVFFNCGWDDFQGLSNNAIQNLVAFVDNGGSVYASDWAYDVVELGWPMYVDFAGNDAIVDDAQTGPPFHGLMTVIEPGLITALNGRTQVPIDMIDQGVGIDALGGGVTRYIEGDRYNNGNTHTVMVSFQPTAASGRVFYTDFHNNGQQDILDLFRWLILQL